MSLLAELAVRGSLAFALVAILDLACAGRVRSAGRRWWWLLVPVAFLLPVHAPVLPAAVVAAAAATAPGAAPVLEFFNPSDGPAAMAGASIEWRALATAIWITGMALYLLTVVVRTIRVQRRWSRERLCTARDLLELLEDCKRDAGVTAPIGLVVSPAVPSPAILGWLRPRILLPADLVGSLARPQLRAVILHELAHFHYADVPATWLFTLARAVHWFNPLAHFAAAGWFRFREEAADETALRWMQASSGESYGRTLLYILRPSAAAVPFGALGIGESFQQLERRMTMISTYTRKTSRPFLVAAVTLCLSALAALQPAAASSPAEGERAKHPAVAAAQAWMKIVDDGNYAGSWSNAAAKFKGALSTKQWTELMQQHRAPLGKSTARVFASLMEKTESPGPGGTTLKGEFATVQFEASFENLKSAVETVHLQKEPDGTWRVAGAFIRPGQAIQGPVDAPPVAQVDPKIYDDYAGRYDYGGGTAIMTVTREGSRIFAQLSGQPKFEIFPKSESEFFWKVVDAQVKFERGSDGKVTKAIHRQNGVTLEAPRMN